MRLIDAGKFEEFIRKKYADGEKSEDIKEQMLFDLSYQPTAYDPDKVVEQLEEVEKIMTSPVNEDCFGEECRASDCTVCLISKAIEIVKGGGVDG